jgi:hypothetical protein
LVVVEKKKVSHWCNVNRHNKTNNQKRTGLFRSFFLLNTLNGNRKKPLKQKLVESQDVVCPVRCAQPRGEFSSKSGIVFLVSLPPHHHII